MGDHIQVVAAAGSVDWTAVRLVKVTVAQNYRCNDCPRVDDDARPAGCNLHPHCRLIHRQVQLRLRSTHNTNDVIIITVSIIITGCVVVPALLTAIPAFNGQWNLANFGPLKNLNLLN